MYELHTTDIIATAPLWYIPIALAACFFLLLSFFSLMHAICEKNKRDIIRGGAVFLVSLAVIAFCRVQANKANAEVHSNFHAEDIHTAEVIASWEQHKGSYYICARTADDEMLLFCMSDSDYFNYFTEHGTVVYVIYGGQYIVPLRWLPVGAGQ